MFLLLTSAALFGGSIQATEPPPPPARGRRYTGTLGGGFDTGSFNSGGSGRCFGGDFTIFVTNSGDDRVELSALRVNGESLADTATGRKIKELLQGATRSFVSQFECLQPGSIRLTLTGRARGRAGAAFSRSFTITYTPVPLGRERQGQANR